MVVRVAENTKRLEGSRKNIKEVLLWAGQFGKAGIISMSFGFPDDNQGIREAIETVQNERSKMPSSSLALGTHPRITKASRLAILPSYIGASVPIPGALPDAVGANITNESKHEINRSYETAPGIVFAYRLHVIRSKDAGEEGELFSDRTAFFSGEAAENEAEEVEIVEVNGAILQEDLDEKRDGYSEKWPEEEEEEFYIVSKN